MVRTLRPVDELLRLADNSIRPIANSVMRVAEMKFRGDRDREAAAIRRLGEVIRQSQALADLVGRKRAFLELDSALGQAPPMKRGNPANFSAFGYLLEAPAHVLVYAETPTIPNVPFGEALMSLTTREPRLARSAEEVAAVYSQEHGFALAFSADTTITEAVQRVIARSIGLGVSPEIAQAQIGMAPLLKDLEPFTLSYAQTVFRTNLSTAYTAGRFRAMSDPDVAGVMRAFQYNAVNDGSVRRGRKEDQGENHLALDGLIAATDWQGWNIYATPNGYSCRCGMRALSVFELKRRGIIRNFDDPISDPQVPSDAAVHPLFARGRPDIQIYLGRTA